MRVCWSLYISTAVTGGHGAGQTRWPPCFAGPSAPLPGTWRPADRRGGRRSPRARPVRRRVGDVAVAVPYRPHEEIRVPGRCPKSTAPSPYSRRPPASRRGGGVQRRQNAPLAFIGLARNVKASGERQGITDSGQRVLQQEGRDPAPVARRRGAHRLHLGVAGVVAFDRTAADQGVTVHNRPAGDVRLTEPVQIEGVLARKRRDRPHLLDMLVEEPGDLRAGDVVDRDIHLALSSCP